MREIKFRGKPIKADDYRNELDMAGDNATLESLEARGMYDGSFVYGSLLYDDDQPYIVGSIEEVTDEYVALSYWIPVIPETVCQFIGRQDRNGIDAYEGDIVEIIERDVAMEIRWDEELSAFKFYENVHALWFDLDCLEVVEITGTIHGQGEAKC